MSTPQLSDAVLLGIAEKFGTPVYAYDAEAIRYQYKALNEPFGSIPHRICYACKALTNINILNLLRKEGAYIDCVSINEVKLALHAGFEKEYILYSPSCPSWDEFCEVADLGVAVHVDSLSLLERIGRRYANSLSVGIRINPELPPVGANINISTGHTNSKFGIPISLRDQIIHVVNKYKIRIIGIHQHTGSDIRDISVLGKVFDTVYQFVDYFSELTYIDIGGGFHVPYYPEEQGMNTQECADGIIRLYHTFCGSYGKQLALWLEPGKYLVSQSGYLLTKVNVLKETPTKKIVAVNSGFHHFIRPTLYGSYHHIKNLSNSEGQDMYNVVGVLCEEDTFAENRKLSKVREGDILCLYNAGAYGFEMASWYNSQPRPAQVLVDGGKSLLIRKSDTLQTIMQQQIRHF